MSDEQTGPGPEPEETPKVERPVSHETAPPPEPPPPDDDDPEDEDEGEGIDTRVLVVVGIIVVLIVIFFWRRSEQSEEPITPAQGQESAASPAGQAPQRPEPPKPGTQAYFRERITESLAYMYRTDQGTMIVAQPPLPPRRTRDGKVIPPREGRSFYTFPLAKGVAPIEFVRRTIGGRPMFANYPLLPLGLPKGAQPVFTEISKLNADKTAPVKAPLADTEPVYGVVVNGESRAYPTKHFWVHDVINDTIGGTPVVLVYNTFAGSVSAYERQADGKPIIFGCSGLQFRGANAVYDIGTWSLWSGLTGEAVTHRMLGKKLKRVPVVSTTFGEWKQAQPQTMLLTGPPRPPYDFDVAAGVRGYHESPILLYPPSNFWPKFQTPLKLPVIGVLTPTGAAAFDADQVKRTGKVTGEIGKTKVVITWSARDGYKAATADGKPLFCQKVYWFAWKSNYPKADYFGPNKGEPIPPPKQPAPAKPAPPKAPAAGSPKPK